MANIVGAKGQVVISKEIRDRLGVGPGWLALQRLADNHVGIYFVPPQHGRSLKGSLREYIETNADRELSWPEIRHRVWSEAAKEQESRATAPADGLS